MPRVRPPRSQSALNRQSVVRHISHRRGIKVVPAKVINPYGQGDPRKTLCSNMTDSTIKSLSSQYAYVVLYFIGLGEQRL
jgi:hypothetical protein